MNNKAERVQNTANRYLRSCRIVLLYGLAMGGLLKRWIKEYEEIHPEETENASS